MNNGDCIFFSLVGIAIAVFGREFNFRPRLGSTNGLMALKRLLGNE